MVTWARWRWQLWRAEHFAWLAMVRFIDQPTRYRGQALYRARANVDTVMDRRP